MILEYYEKYGNFRDEIEILILLFSCFETRSRLHIVILMFRDENEKHRLNFSRSSEKNLSQFSRDLARTRILADLWHGSMETGKQGKRETGKMKNRDQTKPGKHGSMEAWEH